MKKEIYKGYTIKQYNHPLVEGGFLVQIKYAIFRNKTKICDVLNFEYGKKKIDELTGELVK
jgi:hypothetical protein